jgi:hypothetical protein
LIVNCSSVEHFSLEYIPARWGTSPSHRLIPDGENWDTLTRRRWFSIRCDTGDAMTEPHIRRLTLFDYASLAVSKVIYFGGSDADHVSMPALVQAADLPKLLIFAIRGIKTQEEVVRNVEDERTAIAIETMGKKVYSLIGSGVLPAYDPHIFLRIEVGQIATNRDDYLVRLDDVSDWLRTEGIEIGYSVNGTQNNCSEEAGTGNANIGMSDAGNRWPWGKHHTELLGHLEAAASEFWRSYDPHNAKATAPKNNTVIAWLMARNVLGQKRKVSDQMARAIATILRPDDLPTGPRK